MLKRPGESGSPRAGSPRSGSPRSDAKRARHASPASNGIADVERSAVNVVRCLAADMVQKANSGRRFLDNVVRVGLGTTWGGFPFYFSWWEQQEHGEEIIVYRVRNDDLSILSRVLGSC